MRTIHTTKRITVTTVEKIDGKRTEATTTTETESDGPEAEQEWRDTIARFDEFERTISDAFRRILR